MYVKSIRKLYGGNPVTIICWSVSLMMLLILASPALSLAETSPLYRFWSPVNECHFYTMEEAERDKLINLYAHVWTYESIAYYAFETDSEPGLVPAYRFWSPVLETHFYTTSEPERDNLINNYPHVWTYESIAFYAYPEGQQPQDTLPVYRFWSPVLETHFYTMDETEKNKLIDNYPHVWTYESIAWYAFSSPPGPFQGTITEIYDLPATSSTGTYTLKWRVIQGLASNVSYILEDSDISFPSPTPYWAYGGERSYLFTDKPDGTYYYRVMVGSVNSAYSDPASITVNRTTTTAPVLSGPSTVTGAFELTWTYDWPGGLGSNWDGYSLEYSDTPSSSGFEELGFYNSTSSSFAVTITPDPPDFGKTFYFRVRAYSSTTGWSDYSNVISVYISDPVQTRQVTITNQMNDLFLDDVAQVKVASTNNFTSADLLATDGLCWDLPGTVISRGQSRTFDITIDVPYYVFIGMGKWELDLTWLVCPYNKWWKRTYFTNTEYENYWVWTVVTVTGHSGDWEWTITGSYLNGTLKVTPAGSSGIYFNRTNYNPIP